MADIKGSLVIASECGGTDAPGELVEDTAMVNSLRFLEVSYYSVRHHFCNISVIRPRGKISDRVTRVSEQDKK